MSVRFVAESIEITADPFTVECQHFLGIWTNADAGTVEKAAAGGELIALTSGTGLDRFFPDFAIDTGPSGTIVVSGVASGAGVVYVSR